MQITVLFAPAKIRFVVINENMFGYIDPRQPNQAGILMSKPQKGAYHFWMDGPFPLPVDGRGVRPATRADFEPYRFNPVPFENDPAYEVPSA